MSTFAQRVLTLSPFQDASTSPSFWGKGASRGGSFLDEDDDSRLDARQFLNEKSALLARHDDLEEQQWALNLAQLREQRRRPFGPSAAAVIAFCSVALVTSGLLTWAFVRQWYVAGDDQRTLAIVGGSCAGAATLFALLHATATARFLGSNNWAGALRLTDLLLKLALLAVLAAAAATARLWDDEPNLDPRANALSLLFHPLRVYALALVPIAALAHTLALLAGTGLPNRPATLHLGANTRTFAALASVASVATCVLALLTVSGAPAVYFRDPALWASLGTHLLAALLAAALAVAAATALEAHELSGWWLAGLAITTTAAATLGVWDLRDAMPDLRLPLTTSDSFFVVAVTGLASAACQFLAWLHLAVWKFTGSSSSRKTPAAAHYLHF